MLLPITLTAAGGAALINIWLAARVGGERTRSRISVGDGGHQPLIAHMRAHANFVEYSPFILLLIALIELAIGQETWLWLVAGLFLLARVAHGLGMTTETPLKLRGVGTLLTFLILLGLGLYALVLPYMVPSDVPQIIPLG